MSQNGQSYTRRDVARLLNVKEHDLMQGERGVIIEHMERQNGGRLDREIVNRWIAMGAPTPSSLAGATGRMDYTPLAGTKFARGIEA